MLQTLAQGIENMILGVIPHYSMLLGRMQLIQLLINQIIVLAHLHKSKRELSMGENALVVSNWPEATTEDLPSPMSKPRSVKAVIS
jgi:hypothetical protein